MNKIQVNGNAPERAVFYTALYHSLLLPRVASDVDGSYPEFGGSGKIVKEGFTYYDDYSIWDTFRAVHPLILLLDPKRETDMIKSLLEKGREGGFLPIYPAWGSYTSEMIGDHADAIIVDAYAKGLRDFDADLAYKEMRKNAMELPADPALYEDGRGGERSSLT
jgi:putative alpha-1,2-mannosidase